MSDIKATLTYFNFDHFGFYRIRQGKIGEFSHGTIEEIFTDLKSWLNGKSLKETLVYNTNEITRKNTIYCRSFERNETTGDIVMILWHAVGTRSGGVGGAFADESLASNSNQTLVSGTEIDGKEIIWGQPSYYWVIPSHNKLVSIKLPNSHIDTPVFCQYIKSFVDYRRPCATKKESIRTFTHPKSSNEVKTKTVTFEQTSGDGKTTFSLTFKAIAKQYKKETASADLATLSSKVTHVVYRQTIEKSVKDDRATWVKLFDKISNLFGADSEGPTTSETSNIELIVEAKPTPESIQEMLDDYTQEYCEGEWYNIGLKQDGRTGPTTWLNEFVIKDEIYLPSAKNEYYTAKEVLTVLNQHRDRLVSALNVTVSGQEQKSSSIEELAESSDVVNEINGSAAAQA
ncbi:hypothetical protein IG511_12575 [Vibrio cholerae]|uniref:hypothetical protein n=1 Tax=Vibrio cholerae TaxID=666 RepID=UPI002271169B|nr:hypothetical protein [Vibrio cholerae]MCX9489762.1 hypothetical protein [Vibrio cholerae]MCX9521891.1 hypothetical protein [Vibrio cholerae]MCX9523810.1 hypothetical protein [Vibrio cholerae]